MKTTRGLAGAVLIAAVCAAVACSGDDEIPAGWADAGPTGGTSGTGRGAEGGSDAAACADGTEGCPCYRNETCNERLTCTASGASNVCVPEDTTCPAGSEGCRCYRNLTCDVALQCVDGFCVVAGTGGSGGGSGGDTTCPTGSQGCPCYGNDTCNDGLACVGGTCTGVGTGGTGASGGVGGTGGSGAVGGAAGSAGGDTGGAGGAAGSGASGGAGGADVVFDHLPPYDALGTEWRYEQLVGTSTVSTARWYSDRTYTAEDGSPGVVLVGSPNTGGIWNSYYILDDGWLKMDRITANGFPTTYSPPYRLIGASLAVGDEWEDTYYMESSISGWITQQRRVVGVEEITVPAGTFTCVKIHVVQDGVPQRYENYEWWHPDIGLVDSEEVGGNSTYHLTAFTPAI